MAHFAPDSALSGKIWFYFEKRTEDAEKPHLCTIIVSDKRHGHEPYAYLKDLLERLPYTRTN